MTKLNECTFERPKILFVFGTRPEAIKMVPVIAALRATQKFNLRIVITAQHRELLDQVLALADITPDIDLDLMVPDQSLDTLSAKIITRFGAVLDIEKPARVLVHGDTLTTMMTTLACYFRRIPVGHVEAGLRSGNIYAPWPEEVNRKVTGAIADLHFAPTPAAAQALRDENIDESAIFVTGNTVIDALLMARNKLVENPALTPEISKLAERFKGKRIIAVTAHRRENFGKGMHEIADALRKLAVRGDVGIIFPLHPNPNVFDVMTNKLGNIANIALIPPLDYLSFVAMMDLADLILTDSGGVQEEAPSLGKPVLVLRNTTERPEGISAGTSRLVGADCGNILNAANGLLNDAKEYERMACAANPYGDGTAAINIAKILQNHHIGKARLARTSKPYSPAALPSSKLRNSAKSSPMGTQVGKKPEAKRIASS